MADERLIPDPPREQFPSLPDDLRWRIEPPRGPSHYDPSVRRVYLDQRVEKKTVFGTKMVWAEIDFSVWETRKGLGNFDRATVKDWTYTKGLASTMGYLLSRYEERLRPTPDYSDVHGVSKQ